MACFIGVVVLSKHFNSCLTLGFLWCFRSRSRDSAPAENPGNNLYVTGLSTRVSSADLEKFFGNEGKVWLGFNLHFCDALYD